MGMKGMVRSVLKQYGYQIKRVPDGKQSVSQPVAPVSVPEVYSAAVYKSVIREIYELYRHQMFPGLPECTDERLRLLAKLQGTNISEAIYILNSLYNSLPLPGDICEFGVAQGLTSALMAHEIVPTQKNIWLFDSFEGLPKPTEKDLLKDDIFNLGSMEAYEGTMACKVDMVKETLSEISFPFTRAKVVPGFIEETINQPNLPSQVCFAYVDFDFYEPILIALNFLDRVLVPGGSIVVDDYDWFSTGAKTAVDEFVAANGARYEFSLPIAGAGHFAVLKKIGG
jgi:O-methyltransferase